MVAQHYLSFLVIFLGDCRITVTYRVIFHPNFKHPWQYFITSWSQEKVDGWTHPSSMTSICSLIHKKCHPKNYRSDIKYHMTLHFIFSVATYLPTGIPPTWQVRDLRPTWPPCLSAGRLHQDQGPAISFLRTHAVRSRPPEFLLTRFSPFHFEQTQFFLFFTSSPCIRGLVEYSALSSFV